jgi:hypothetical protein
MITLAEALSNYIRQEGRPNEYRINRITFCTCDRKAGTGGQRIYLGSARLAGSPPKKKEKSSDPEKVYRRGKSWMDFYDEDTRRHYRVHIDLIEYVNEIEIS